LIELFSEFIRGFLISFGGGLVIYCVIEKVMRMTDRTTMKLDDYKDGMARIERSVCDCDQCKCGCKAQPGFLAPGDLEKIANYLGHDPYDSDFLTESFSASEGSTVIDRGQLKQIPTIVPKQQDDGRCVFLDSSDRCTIHPVSPFGCRNFKICDDEESPQESGRKIGLALAAIDEDASYQYTWGELAFLGNFARPIIQRKKELLDHLSKVNRRDTEQEE
jgi:Fe-S-cluster containining protein